ncbi:unnamed protein product [Tuber melanosporum]|uniref:(Perigord truffle) hypothetical protein n=1 Tax=Tuber melanosporum (strain Mel28) TaxID=656061 RepID=D5GF57_TUBMM|nr:uncharacterized protein GSTUM_00001864001 [Tuber melanosporum]CAZ83150.1 unnamed protein product [Tuber melanosporum]
MPPQSSNPPFSTTNCEVPDDAISLRSAAPSYTSSLPPAYSDQLPLSSPRVPEQRHSSLLTSLPENYNVTAWSSLTGSGHQNRAYENVAERRARRDAARMHANSLLVRANNAVRAETQRAEEAPHSVSLAEDGKSWDFLISQMANWESREKSWNNFRARFSKDQSRIPFPKKKIGMSGRFG